MLTVYVYPTVKSFQFHYVTQILYFTLKKGYMLKISAIVSNLLVNPAAMSSQISLPPFLVFLFLLCQVEAFPTLAD
jgi:hypothetical protein